MSVTASDVGGSRHERGATVGLLTALMAVAYVDRVSVTHAIGPASIEFQWDAVQVGWILSAFSWGYVVAMIPGGWIVDKVGGRRAVIGGTALWGLVSGAAAAIGGAVTLALNRFLLGATEAPAFPAAASITAHDFPPAERGRATALFDGGSYIGMALGGPLVAGAVAWAGWRAGFLAAAGLTVVWLAASTAIFGFHKQHRHVAPIAAHRSPWPRISFLLRQASIWSLGLGFFGYNYVKSFYLTWFALYLTRSLGMNTVASGIASAFPPLLAVVASLSVGHLTDKLAAKRLDADLGYLRGRISAAAMVAASTIALVPILTTDALRLAVLGVAFASNIAASPGIWALPGDLAPDNGWVGTIGGVVNTMANVGGIVSPIATGYLIQGAGDSFDLALLVAGGVALLSSLMFISGGRYRRMTYQGQR